MPWRSLIDADFRTYETGDMSQEKLDSLRSEGWIEATPLETQLAKLCRGYGLPAVRLVLEKLATLVDGTTEEK